MQLVSAILLIIFLMTLWQTSRQKNNENLMEHSHYVAKQQLQQAIVGISVILEQPSENKRDQQTFLQHYLDGLIKVNFVNQAHLYDETGLLIATSISVKKDKEGHELTPTSPKSINDLYGISPFQRDLSARLTPFVDEIRGTGSTSGKLHGYLRFTIEPSYLINKLAQADEEQQSLQRLMLLLAGLVGFLLTRGLNRLSRRGYRLSDKTNKVMPTNN